MSGAIEGVRGVKTNADVALEHYWPQKFIFIVSCFLAITIWAVVRGTQMRRSGALKEARGAYIFAGVILLGGFLVSYYEYQNPYIAPGLVIGAVPETLRPSDHD